MKIAKKSYAELLRDPRWQRRRLEIMNRDEFRCRRCRDATSTLNVHHTYYRKGAKPWEYEDVCLITLCESCHAVAERIRDSVCREPALALLPERCVPKLLESIRSFAQVVVVRPAEPKLEPKPEPEKPRPERVPGWDEFCRVVLGHRITLALNLMQAEAMEFRAGKVVLGITRGTLFERELTKDENVARLHAIATEYFGEPTPIQIVSRLGAVARAVKILGGDVKEVRPIGA